jgi:hypothetical protein
VEGLRRKSAAAEAARHHVPSYAPRQTLNYCRFADDYLVVMGGDGKAEAHRLKEAMAPWLQEQLGRRQHPDKTRITHWSQRVRFVGYDLRGQRNRNGTRWARLLIPPEAERDLKQRVKRVCGYTQITAADLLMRVNALLRGWTQYYCYASNATRRFGYLTGVAFWLTAHYLGRTHRRSMKRLMAHHYGRDPRTGQRALYVTLAGEKRLFLWNKPPQQRSILSGQVLAHATRPVMMTAGAGGQSYEQRLALRARDGDQCQHCGRPSPGLVVHHPQRRTARKKLQAACRRMTVWIKQHRHLPGREFCRQLNIRLQGHYQYYGVRGNFHSLQRFFRGAIQNAYKWLNRRGGKRKSYTWEQYTQVLDRVKIARPRLTEVRRRRAQA